MLDCKLTILSNSALEQIHAAALAILADTGLRVEHPRMVQLLRKEGCQLAPAGDMVRFPKDVIERHLARAQAAAVPQEQPRDLCLTVYASARYIFDDVLGRTRDATWSDLVDGIRVGDSMRYADSIGPVALPCDIPAEGCNLRIYAELYRRTRKGVGPLVVDRESIDPMFDLCSIYLGSAEEVRRSKFMSYSAFVTSPLIYTHYALDLAFEFADRNLPVSAGGTMALTGATAPATLAGTLALGGAETLSGLVLTHILGGDGGYCNVPAVLDQNTMMACYASPEKILMSVAQMDLRRFYGFESYGAIHTGKADSGMVDVQAGAERAYTMLLGALAGSRCAYAGELSCEVGSVTQLLIDDELCSLVNRLLEGVSVDESTLCVDLIRDMGPGADYVSDSRSLDVTMKHFRQEFWLPTIFARRQGDKCILGDGDAYARARQRVADILSQPEQFVTDDDQDRQIQDVLDRAAKARE